MIDFGLTDRRAIVVGAGFRSARAGHGRGTCLQLAAAGAVVACVDIDQARARDIAAEVIAAGGRAFPVTADVTDPAQAEAAIGTAIDRMGGIDVVVDVVGESIFERSHEFRVEDWKLDLRRNLSQVFYVCRSAVRHMIEQGTGGSITAITSVEGLGASRYHVAYGSAKAGVISLMKTYAEEYGAYGIRANAVAPGNVGGGNWGAPDIPFGGDAVNPLAPPRAMDIANAVLFLSSNLAARITGQTLIVDGGATIRNPWGFDDVALKRLRSGEIPRPGTVFNQE